MLSVGSDLVTAMCKERAVDLVTTKERDYVAVHGAAEAVAALERRLEVWDTEANAT